MNVTVTFTDSNVVLAVQVSPEMLVSDFEAYVLEEAGLKEDVILLHNDSRLDPSKTLEESGLASEDMILAIKSNDLQQDPRIEQARQEILYEPNLLKTITERMPELGQAIHDPVEFAEAYRKYYKPNQEQTLSAMRNKQINENLALAMEEMPETFAETTMLYIPVEVNKVPVKFFVDSGAQSTIMSEECAEKCGLSHLIDTRSAGTAFGVGQSQIRGKIHLAPIKVGSSFLNCSFLVLENMPMEVLLGLDMLKHHQAVLDLGKQCLILGDETIPFLPESEIPKVARELQNQNPQNQNQKSQQNQNLQTQQKPTQNQPTQRVQRKPINQTPASSGTSFVGPGHSLGLSGPPPGPPPPPRPYPEEVIKNLMGLGFSRDQVIGALGKTNGNPDMAASLLFE